MRTLRWKWVVLLMLAYMVMCLILVGQPWVERSMRAESAANESVLGPIAMNMAQQRATRWYQHAFVDTGVVASSMDLTHEEPIKGAPGFGHTLMHDVRVRIQVLWTLMYLAFLRVSVAGIWFPLGALLVLAAALDGFARRKIKQTNFGLASPERFGISVVLFELTVAAGMIALFAPIAIPPIAPMFFFGLLALTTMVGASNLHKRL